MLQVPSRPSQTTNVLQGTWVCVATIKDGKQVSTAVGVRAVIEGNNMTWYSPSGDGTYKVQQTRFRIDTDREPKQFDWWAVENPEKIDFRIYSLSDDVLRWATHLDYKTRPETFTSGHWQFTMQRERPGGFGQGASPNAPRVRPDQPWMGVARWDANHAKWRSAVR